MEKLMVEILVEDIVDHANQLRDLSETENPDSEQVEYHHARLIRKIGVLRGAM